MKAHKYPASIENGEIMVGKTNLIDLDEEEMRKTRLKEIAMIPQGAMNSLNPVKRIKPQIMDALIDHDLKLSKTEKKDFLSKKDRKDWENFLKDKSNIPDKDQVNQSKNQDQVYKYDLHGLTLSEANKKVKEIIISCSEKNYREILLITGKGLHSRDDDVYKSSKLSKLRYSVPEYINSEPEISKLIISVVNPSRKEGGDGALLIKLKKL